MEMEKKRESGCYAPAWIKVYKMHSPVLFWHDIPKSSQESWIRAISWYHNDNASIAEKLLPVEARKDMTQKNLASTRIEHIFLVLTTSIPSLSRSLMVSATHHHQTH
jgi:hypothetical protein